MLGIRISNSIEDHRLPEVNSNSYLLCVTANLFGSIYRTRTELMSEIEFFHPSNLSFSLCCCVAHSLSLSCVYGCNHITGCHFKLTRDLFLSLSLSLFLCLVSLSTAVLLLFQAAIKRTSEEIGEKETQVPSEDPLSFVLFSPFPILAIEQISRETTFNMFPTGCAFTLSWILLAGN